MEVFLYCTEQEQVSPGLTSHARSFFHVLVRLGRMHAEIYKLNCRNFLLMTVLVRQTMVHN